LRYQKEEKKKEINQFDTKYMVHEV